MKKTPKKKAPRGAADLPPSVRVDPEQLAAEAQALGSEATDKPRGRGRPPGSKNRPKDDQDPQALDYPIEALAMIHKGLWKAIAESLRSSFLLTDTGAQEMATWANLCLKQYLSPMMAEYTPLAGYMMAQLAALGTCFAMRHPKAILPVNPAVGKRGENESPN